MSLASAVLLIEAGAFTAGCAVLRTRWFEPERIGMGLMLVIAALALAALIALTPEGITLNVGVLDPEDLWPQPH